MDESTYDYREHVQTYIQTERKNHPHAAFEQYYARLLTLLEQVFDSAQTKLACDCG